MTRPTPSLSFPRKIAFATVTALVMLGLLEFLLAIAGVRPGIDEGDPYLGFVGGAPLYQEQGGSGLMVTSPAKLTLFNYQEFPREKSGDTYRIFCLGGSTTYGRPYDDHTSFPGWLRAYLDAAEPARNWEVINAGGVSYASYRVARLMEELTGYEPDLFIVYTGQNEFLERRTYASMQEAPGWIRSLNVQLARSRLFSVVQRLVRSIQGADDSQPTDATTLLPAEVKTILDGAVGPRDFVRDDALQSDIVEHFSFNLRRMIDIAGRAGARIVFVNPASNLADCSPFRSQFSVPLDDDDRRRWADLMEQSRTADTREALRAVDAALDLDPRRADAHYRRARILLALGDEMGARQAFERALDEDVCPLRAISGLHEALRKVSAERDVPLVDFLSLLEARSTAGIPGRELFLDHVHPTIEGNRILGEALVEELSREGVVQPQAGWGPEARAEVDARVLAGVDREAHAAALRNLAKVLSWAGKSDEAGDLAERAFELNPQDPDALLQLAMAKERAGEIDEAIALVRRAIALQPGSGTLHAALGRLHLARGETALALLSLESAVQIRPDDPDILNNLGIAYLQAGQPEEAIRLCERVREIDPSDARSWNNQGSAELALRRFDAAMESYRRALEITPHYAAAWYGLGVVQGQLQENVDAIESMEHAIEIDPEKVDAHYALGVLYRRMGRDADAAAEFRTVLSLDPEHAPARLMLGDD